MVIELHIQPNDYRIMFSKRIKYLQHYRNEQTFLSGLLTGVAGLAIGFLVAPRSGKELRKQIADGVDDQWDKTKSQAKEAINNLKSSAGALADKAQDGLDDAKEKAGHLVDSLK
jgi:gas vesicle protein